MQEKIYASFEIGHSSWKFLVLKICKEKINILYSKMSSMTNLFYGNKLADPRVVAKILEDEMANASKVLQISLYKVIYIIPSFDLDIQQTKFNQKFHTNHVINENDIKNFQNKIHTSHNYNEDLKLINVVNNYYILDNDKKYYYEPIGKSCKLINLNATMYYIPEVNYDSYLVINLKSL